MCIRDKDKLLGVTKRGGVEDNGLLFCYDLNQASYEVLFEFEGSGVGFRPEMIKPLADGKLYGLTSGRFGTIFEFDYTLSEATLIYEFPNDLRGLIPEVLLANNGHYYGVTGTSGIENSGTLFRYNPSEHEFSVVQEFLTSSGPHIPGAPLLESSDGNLYGSTIYTTNITTGINIFQYDPRTDHVDFQTQYTEGTSMYKLIEITTGQSEMVLTSSEDRKIQLYPNPLKNGPLFIKLNNDLNVEVVITALTGKIVHRKTYFQVQNIDIALETPGLYAVEIVLENRKSSYFRVLKQ